MILSAGGSSLLGLTAAKGRALERFFPWSGIRYATATVSTAPERQAVGIDDAVGPATGADVGDEGVRVGARGTAVTVG
ncbi:hypothetical protein AB0D12_35540 [Streptomyces sp. NPDC048479]|uniref:hypothetical protein n=1 Tax=Streptomyces sp. NPDC048479 TaxID=3154725 RepID=UPI00344233F2